MLFLQNWRMTTLLLKKQWLWSLGAKQLSCKDQERCWLLVWDPNVPMQLVMRSSDIPGCDCLRKCDQNYQAGKPQKSTIVQHNFDGITYYLLQRLQGCPFHIAWMAMNFTGVLHIAFHNPLSKLFDISKNKPGQNVHKRSVSYSTRIFLAPCVSGRANCKFDTRQKL